MATYTCPAGVVIGNEFNSHKRDHFDYDEIQSIEFNKGIIFTKKDRKFFIECDDPELKRETINDLIDNFMIIRDDYCDSRERDYFDFDSIKYYEVEYCEPQPLKDEDFTCHKCISRVYCEYAYDDYNLDGDCLACK